MGATVLMGRLRAVIDSDVLERVLGVAVRTGAEFAEVYEPFAHGRGSSSTMPQKRNPISSVYITAQSGVIRTQVAALLNAMEQDHERATGQWEIEWIVLPDGRLPAMPEPAILLGDFNCQPASPAYRAVREAGFADALELAGLAAHEGVTFPGSKPPLRLDHVFLSPTLVSSLRRAWIDEEADGSDHQPVWVDLA